ncbi:MAG: inorganic phosphate transporter [Bacteroidetes bacterium]|nr:inorganic phosphate transporter [Bacteroidota bacterium]
MEIFYLIVVIVLFGLAISDLIVGVSNDAVNFLNSAIGSKAAPFKIIMLIASVGVVVGATFSSGLMEVARKGIFHPDQFTFAEIMVIFLAVMITDVLLLDTFNTYGLPTSTTVSIVFELLGAAVAVSIIKIITIDGVPENLGNYINSAKALAIISGILVSIAIAFSVGAIVQYFARMLFTFKYQTNLKYFGSIWGGLATTAITYFILIKGAKGSSFISEASLQVIEENTGYIILLSFVGWTFIFQLISWFTRINILKIIVMIGTFALAMAFAGNDLVNFIGVPLAGYESFRAFLASPEINPNSLNMVALTKSIQTPTYMLLLAGLVMVFTLWTSKKARSVTATEVNLGRQGEGSERFDSTLLSRTIVRQVRKLNETISAIIPENLKQKIDKRFEQPKKTSKKKTGETKGNFDLIRASVNLVVASILIAFGTSLKLPLSTTYVTFMVAMGTSLSDRAWGRESAVYRITGVLSVVGGWFLTAFSAFVVSFLIALAIFYGGIITILIFIVIAIFFIIKTHAIHKKREKNNNDMEMFADTAKEINEANVVSESASTITNILRTVPEMLKNTFTGLASEDLRGLKKNFRDASEIIKKTKYLKDSIHKTIARIEEDIDDTGPFYVQVVDYLKEISNCIYHISRESYKHVDNNHKGLLKIQVDETQKLMEQIQKYFDLIILRIEKNSFEKMASIGQLQDEILDNLETYRKNQIKRIKTQEAGTKNSLLYMNILAEIKYMMLYLNQLVKSMQEFIQDHDNDNQEK